MRDDHPERFRSTPYYKEQAGGRRGAKEEEQKRADRLRFWRGARLWRLHVSRKRERCGPCSGSGLQEEEKVSSCETRVDAMMLCESCDCDCQAATASSLGST